MIKIDDQIEPLDDKVTPVTGLTPSQFFTVKQGTFTPVDFDTVDNTYSAAEANIIRNLRIRSIETEHVLIKAGIIKGTYIP